MRQSAVLRGESRWIIGSLTAGLALTLAGCGSQGGAAATGTPGTGSTFYADAKPIFDAKCVMCHYDGGIAPFSLQSYDSAKPLAGVIKMRVSDKTMPPWPPSDSCAEYWADRSIDDKEIAIINKWVEDGALEGDPNNPGKPIDKGEQQVLSRVDKKIDIGAPYTMKTTPDDYHCFVIDWGETTTKYISGFKAEPGNAKVVHHVIAFLAQPADIAAVQALDDAEPGPGYTCFGGSGVNTNEWVGAWAPGSLGSDFPAGTGIKVPPGSKIVLQVHYNANTAGVQPDQTAVDFKLDDSVQKEGRIQPWANPQWLQNKDSMKIPAMQADVMHNFSFDATYVTGGKPFTIYSANLHMHQLGTHAKIEIQRPGGAKECMLEINDWNFHWQGSYGFKQTKQYNQGDEMYLECHWDNTPPHQPIIDGKPQTPHDVFWGERTTDEMCLGGFYLTVP